MKKRAADYFYSLTIRIMLTVSAAFFVLMALWIAHEGTNFFVNYPVRDFILSASWAPDDGSFGIFSMALSSLMLALFSTAAAEALALLSAGFAFTYFTENASKALLRISGVLSGMPSVLFGLIGMTTVVPWIGENVKSAQKSGGAGLLASVAVVSAMLLPSMFVTFYDALVSADRDMLFASCALGATKTETLFGCSFLLIRSAAAAAGANSFRRALGEATAVILVSGNSFDGKFSLFPIRTLAGTLVLEMGYAEGIHRSALFAIGFFLLAVTLLLPTYRGGR